MYKISTFIFWELKQMKHDWTFWHPKKAMLQDFGPTEYPTASSLVIHNDTSVDAHEDEKVWVAGALKTLYSIMCVHVRFDKSNDVKYSCDPAKSLLDENH